jgi:hypothetical protein
VVAEFDAQGELIQSTMGFTDYAGTHVKTAIRGEDGEIIEKVTSIGSLLDSVLKGPPPESMAKKSFSMVDFSKSVPLHVTDECFDFAGAEEVENGEDGETAESGPGI